MVVALIPNNAQRTVDNARAVAAEKWPGEKLEVLNPARMNVKAGVDTRGVVGVIVAGGFDNVTKHYKRARIPVVEIAVIGDYAQRDNHAGIPNLARMTQEHEQLARQMIALPADKLRAIAGAIVDLSFLLCLMDVEKAQQEPRQEVIAHIITLYNEAVSCVTS